MESPSKAPNYTFVKSHQATRLLIPFMLRWLITAVLCGAIAGAIYGFYYRDLDNSEGSNGETGVSKPPGAITADAKKWFGALVTILQIMLAVNISDTISEFSEVIRWRLISWDFVDPHVFDLVMGSSKLLNWIMIIYHRKTSLWLRVFALLWILIFTAGQTGTATIGLTFEINYSSDESTATHAKIDQGSVTDLYMITLDGTSPSADPSERPIAQTYVQQGLPYLAVPDTFARINDSSSCLNLTNFGKPPSDAEYRPSDLISPRTITSKAECVQILHFATQNNSAKAAPQLSLTFIDSRGQPRILLVENIPNNSTTFFPRTDASIGPRSVQIFALWAGPFTINTTLYDCTNTVTQVNFTNALGSPAMNMTNFTMPDQEARNWAGAVGWDASEGTNSSASSAANVLSQQNSIANSITSLVSNPSNPHPSTRHLEGVIANCTLGGIHAYDLAGPTFLIPKLDVVAPSYSVEPNAAEIAANLGALAFLHFLLALLVIASVWSVAIPNETDSILRMSLLLKNAAARARDGDEKALHREKIAYGCTKDEPRCFYVGPRQDAVMAREFPTGDYY